MKRRPQQPNYGSGGSTFMRSRSTSPTRARYDEVFEQVDGEESLTTVVCNAGIGFITALVDTTEEEYDRLMAVNVKGVFFVMQAALRRMVPRGRGSVVVISSTSGFTSSTKPMAIYDASKAAVKMFTVSAAREVAASGVRVNAVAPGRSGRTSSRPS